MKRRNILTGTAIGAVSLLSGCLDIIEDNEQEVPENETRIVEDQFPFPNGFSEGRIVPSTIEEFLETYGKVTIETNIFGNDGSIHRTAIYSYDPDTGEYLNESLNDNSKEIYTDFSNDIKLSLLNENLAMEEETAIQSYNESSAVRQLEIVLDSTTNISEWGYFERKNTLFEEQQRIYEYIIEGQDEELFIRIQLSEEEPLHMKILFERQNGGGETPIIEMTLKPEYTSQDWVDNVTTSTKDELLTTIVDSPDGQMESISIEELHPQLEVENLSISEINEDGEILYTHHINPPSLIEIEENPELIQILLQEPNQNVTFDVE